MPMPSITMPFARRGSAVASAPTTPPPPPIHSPTPRSFRDKWLDDKRYKENRSPELTNGNGFDNSMLVPLPSRRPTTAPPKRKASSNPATSSSKLGSLLPARRKLLSRSRIASFISFLCIIALLRVAAHAFLPSSIVKPSLSTSSFLAPIYLVPSKIARPFSNTFSSSSSSLAVSTAPKHRYTENGLLEVNPDVPAAEHPIYELIENAKREWEEKNARQSKTLEEAVAEYKRRNGGMSPPKGFDHWWKYVQINRVSLPDEYDRINIDLAPFHAFSPSFLRSRVARMQETEDTFTLSVQSGHVSTNHITYDSAKIGGSDDRRNGQVDLIRSVAKWIPDFDAVYSIHDSPTRFISDMHLEELKELAEDGEYYDPGIEMDTSMSGWKAACSPRSPLRRARGEDVPIPNEKSFIVSHTKTMDLCEHPSVLGLHGTTAGIEPLPQGDLMPIFSLSKTKFHADILGIPVEQWGEEKNSDVVQWDTKTDPRLLWRGRNTGAYFSRETKWRDSHRARLASMVDLDLETEVEVLPAPLGEKGEKGETLGNRTKEEKMGRLSEMMFDIGLAYDPIQCHSDDGTCDLIRQELTFRKVLTFEQETNYKYILDVDGNAWSARFKRLLTTGSLVLKSTIYPEWWNDRIQPWLHYVPVKVDYSDVYDIMAFFRGDDDEGITGENDLARQIAAAGNVWSSENWRKEDMTAYMFRLYLEWARLVSPKRGLMDFEFTTEPVIVVDAPVSPASPKEKAEKGKGKGGRTPFEKQRDALDFLRVARPLKREEPVVVASGEEVSVAVEERTVEEALVVEEGADDVESY